MESTLPPTSERALALALDGLDAGRWVLVDAAGRLDAVGDGVGMILQADEPEPGAAATTVLGEVGDPLPEGVARCVLDGGDSLEGTFAPVAATAADAVAAELHVLAATLGAPAERPALRALLTAVAGIPATAGPSDRVATLVVLRRMDVPAPPDPFRAQPPATAEPRADAVPASVPLPTGIDPADLRGADVLATLAPVLAELAALRGVVDALRDGDREVREAAEAARRDAALSREDAEAARREAAMARDELDALRDDVQRGSEELAEAVRSAILVSEDARRDARRAATDAEHARAELSRVRSDEDDVAVVRPERVVEIWREMVARNTPSALDRRAAERRLEARSRDHEPGFDDVQTPLAHVGLDGRFERLNPAFARLVGYAEDDFAKATWPSLLDRAVYDAQLEQFDALVAGEAERVALDASYLGGSGLLVTVRGHVELVRQPSGEPSHLLLVGEDRHTL